MVKKEQILKRIERKKEVQKQYQQEIGATSRQLDLLKQKLEDIDLEIFLLEKHIKKVEG